MKAFVAILSFFTIGCSSIAQDNEYSFKENYKMSVPARLSLSSSDGNIDVIPGEGNDITVYYIVRKKGKTLSISRKELEEEMIVEVSHNSDNLEIRVKNKDNWRWSFSDWDQMHVSFRVVVPRQTACDLHTSDGNVAMKGLTGDQRCKTSDGNIYVREIKGSLTGGTSDGNIQLKNIDGGVAVKTSDGNVQLDKVSGDVEASTSDGNIQVSQINGGARLKTSDGDISFSEISGAISASTSDGSIRGTVNELKKELSLRTSDGNIDVTIPGNLGLDLDIKGESLNVPLTNFSGESDKHSIRGKSNGGGITVNLHTSDGHVRLAYR